MRTHELDVVRQRLLERRRDLLLRYQTELALSEEELAGHAPEVEEVAQEQWDARVLGRMAGADARRLASVVGALRRLDRDAYGACITCGDVIDRDRLAAIPEVATCIRCAEARER